MLDEKLTKQIIAFLDIPEPTEDDIRQAAMIALRINHNRILYQNIILRPRHMCEKLKYELNKHLKYRLDGMTLADVHKMDETLMPKVEDLVDNPTDNEETPEDGIIDGVPVRRLGIREDHNELPAEIKALWDDNCDRWKKMKELFFTCKGIKDSCDRYEHLKILSELYTQYKKDMEKYDTWQPGKVTDAVADANKIAAARTYISKNRPKYEKLVADNDEEARLKLFDKIQQRVSTLRENNVEFSEELAAWLKDNGFK